MQAYRSVQPTNKSASPPLWGEREGPAKREGEVGSAANRPAGLNRIDIRHYGPDRCLTGFLARQRGALPMPWKETCVMDEKTAFIAEYLRGELPMTALCDRTITGHRVW